MGIAIAIVIGTYLLIKFILDKSKMKTYKKEIERHCNALSDFKNKLSAYNDEVKQVERDITDALIFKKDKPELEYVYKAKDLFDERVTDMFSFDYEKYLKENIRRLCLAQRGKVYYYELDIGYFSREVTPMFENLLIEIFREQGIEVFLVDQNFQTRRVWRDSTCA